MEYLRVVNRYGLIFQAGDYEGWASDLGQPAPAVEGHRTTLRVAEHRSGADAQTVE